MTGAGGWSWNNLLAQTGHLIRTGTFEQVKTAVTGHESGLGPGIRKIGILARPLDPLDALLRQQERNERIVAISGHHQLERVGQIGALVVVSDVVPRDDQQRLGLKSAAGTEMRLNQLRDAFDLLRVARFSAMAASRMAFQNE